MRQNHFGGLKQLLHARTRRGDLMDRRLAANRHLTRAECAQFLEPFRHREVQSLPAPREFAQDLIGQLGCFAFFGQLNSLNWTKKGALSDVKEANET